MTDPIMCTVSGIQHFSPCPGHGLRTMIFLVGCPLRCPWCCNPESRVNAPVLVCNAEKCIGPHRCRHCMDACPRSAIYINRNNIGIARDICDNCGACARRCPSGALFMSGRKMSLPDIMDHILKDKDFIANGGGVTLSGGEPMMHPLEVSALLRLTHAEGLHNAIETCGFFDLDAPETIAALKETDLLFFDVKHSDPRQHRAFTGVDNNRILSNLRRLYAEFPHLEIVSRTLVVPGFNDTAAAMRDIARIVKRNGSRFHVLEAYSPICQDKYAQLGLPFDASPRVPPAEQMRAFVNVFQEEGVTVEVH